MTDPIANLRTLLAEAHPENYRTIKYGCPHRAIAAMEQAEAHLNVAMRAALPKLLAVAEAAETASRECDCVSGDEYMQALKAALAALREGTP